MLHLPKKVVFVKCGEKIVISAFRIYRIMLKKKFIEFANRKKLLRAKSNFRKAPVPTKFPAI
jgi:hypothetical protein